jgi:hypothetical protein
LQMSWGFPSQGFPLRKHLDKAYLSFKLRKVSGVLGTPWGMAIGRGTLAQSLVLTQQIQQ